MLFQPISTTFQPLECTSTLIFHFLRDQERNRKSISDAVLGEECQFPTTAYLADGLGIKAW